MHFNYFCCTSTIPTSIFEPDCPILSCWAIIGHRYYFQLVGAFFGILYFLIKQITAASFNSEPFCTVLSRFERFLGYLELFWAVFLFLQSSFGFKFFHPFSAPTTGGGDGTGVSCGAGDGHHHHPRTLWFFLHDDSRPYWYPVGPASLPQLTSQWLLSG